MIGMHVQFGGCLSIECPPFSKTEDEIGIEYPISRVCAHLVSHDTTAINHMYAVQCMCVVLDHDVRGTCICLLLCSCMQGMSI